MDNNMKEKIKNMKYCVRLGASTNSFYDVNSAANMFRNTPFYYFNHKPTKAIITAIKGERLIDVHGNIPLDDKPLSTSEPVDIDAIKAQLRKEVESEVRAEVMAEQAEKEEAQAKRDAKAKAADEKSATEPDKKTEAVTKSKPAVK